MTAVTPDAIPDITVRKGPRWALSDILVIAKRDLIRYVRTPDLIIFGAIQPVMFVLLFAYVFGGSIQLPGFEFSYRQYLMAGIFVQTIVFGSVASTAIGIAEDQAKGIVDRFRSLPMTRSSLLIGRTLSDTVRNIGTLAILIAVAYAVGFRFRGGVLATIGAILLALLFGFAMSWIAACIGLVVRSTEAAQSGGLIWLFPLTFASSAFVGVEQMPGWLQGFAKANPVSVTVNALRAWFDDTPVGDNAWQSLAWSAGIMLVFIPLAVRLYRKATTR